MLKKGIEKAVFGGSPKRRFVKYQILSRIGSKTVNFCREAIFCLLSVHSLKIKKVVPITINFRSVL